MQSVRVVLEQPWVVGGLLLVAAMSVVAARQTGRHGHSSFLVGLTIAAVACIPVLTLYPSGPLGRFPQNCAGALLSFPGFQALFRTHDGILNVLLFVPAGGFLSLLAGRATRAILCLALLSFAIEVLQGMMGNHSCTNADWWANSIGAMLGAVFAVRSRGSGPDPDSGS